MFGSTGCPGCGYSGSFGFVGSSGLFGYGFGSKFVPSGGVTPVGGVSTHDPNFVYTTFRF